MNNRQGGNIWLIALIIAVVVVGIWWMSNRAEIAPEEANTAATPTSPTGGTTGTAGKTNTGGTTVTTPTQPIFTSSGAYLITYNSSGFKPAELTISAGKSVHFVNNSNSAMRIAPVDSSNPPYYSFAQSKSVGKGGTFDFLFSVKGAYRYFNENNPLHAGIITVR